MKLSDAEVTPLTPSYAHGILICGWGTHMRVGHRATKATIGDDGDDGDDGDN
jgi:hypothetical protein